MEDIYVYIYIYIYIKYIYILNGIVGILLFREITGKKRIFRRGASPEKVWQRGDVKGSGDDGSSEIDRGVDGYRWEISCNCDYADRGGQAVDTLTRELNRGLI